MVALIALHPVIVTQLGLRLGQRLSKQLRERAERLGGIALTPLGLVLLGEQLLA